MHRFSWSTKHFPPAGVGGLLPEFFSCPSSFERDTTAQACRFSCFFCAAYGLLLTQTRTWCSNSASRAIAMLEKTVKISPNVCAGISLSNECGHVENSYIFSKDVMLTFGACGLSAHTAPIKMAIANYVEQPFAQNDYLSEIKVQISPLVRAYLWQIFAGLASIAIALKTLFERMARVCLKSNP